MKCSTCGHHLHTCPTCGHTEPSTARPLRTTPPSEEEQYAARVMVFAFVLGAVAISTDWIPLNAAAMPVLLAAFALGAIPWDRRTPAAVRTGWRYVTGRHSKEAS